MRMIRVALIADVLYKWDGGVDFLSNIATIFESIGSQEYSIQIFLFVPEHNVGVKCIKNILLREKYDDAERKEILLKVFREACSNYTVVSYKKAPRVPFLYDDGKKLDKYLRKYRIDIALPIMQETFLKLKTPWIGYIPDLQGKYLPELYCEKELECDDKRNKMVTGNVKYLLATSQAVKNDILHFYPETKSIIFATPFAPVIAQKYTRDCQMNFSKYECAEKYFIISNQFWGHKSHDTAFKAMERLYKEGYKDIMLFCTGKLQDYRNDSYQRSLSELLSSLECRDNIKILGYIPKVEQIALIQGAVALIQPSKYEGDCGGCSVYLANGLCVPSILSDIPVNKEGEGTDGLEFFKTGDDKELAEKMKKYLTSQPEKISEIDRINRKERNIKVLSEFYLKMILDVMENF